MTDDNILRAAAQLENPNANLPIVLAAIAAFELLADESPAKIIEARRTLFRSLAPYDGLHDGLFAIASLPDNLAATSGSLQSKVVATARAATGRSA